MAAISGRDGGKTELQYRYWSGSSCAIVLDLGIAMGEFKAAADQRVGYVGERDNVLPTSER